MYKTLTYAILTALLPNLATAEVTIEERGDYRYITTRMVIRMATHRITGDRHAT